MRRRARCAWRSPAAHQIGAVEQHLPDTMRPASGSRRITDSAVIDLPLPDSPSSAKVSPGALERQPSTARTTASACRAR
jgi:hypothetical protein